MFELKYETTLRSFLAHIHSQARRMAALYYQRDHHPDSVNPSKELMNPAIKRMWESMRTDLRKLLHVELLPFHELPSASTFTHPTSEGHKAASWLCNDPFQVQLGVLKKKADKARRKDPSITFLRTIVLEKNPLLPRSARR